MPRSSEIICLGIFAFTTPFRFINQRTCGNLYYRVLRVILMTSLITCYFTVTIQHSASKQQAVLYELSVFTSILVCCELFVILKHTHTGSRSTPLRSCAFISIRSPRNVTHRQCSSWNEFACWQVRKL